ncbi:MAG: chorismate synthase [Phycisphaerales bacterium]|nr:chorismate synthase [Phycisphaerales bacterium]
MSYITAGESHGPALIALVQGMPAGVPVDVGFINAELRRRQGGYGRGGRQRIEHDEVEILSGVRRGRTIGSPVALRIANRDSRLDDLQKTPPVHRPRPGHADLAGSVKWLTTDCRETLERASARETAARTAAGALSRLLLREIGVEAFAFVRRIHAVETAVLPTAENWRDLMTLRDASDVYCPDHGAGARMEEAIRGAKVDKDTVGGLIEAHVFGAPMGLGSCMHWEDKLDARLAFAAMSIQAIKAVEIGLGKDVASRRGSEVHDPIGFDRAGAGGPSLGFTRPTNNAGGTEGGMSNGQPIVVRAAMKPISTLLRGLPSVDLNTREAQTSAYERSDVCAVSAASVVLENVVAFEMAAAALEKFGGDSLLEFTRNHAAFLDAARELPLDPPMGTVAGA